MLTTFLHACWLCALNCRYRQKLKAHYFKLHSRSASWTEPVAIFKTHMYIRSQNKTPTQSFCDNFGKCGLNLIILSPLHSAVNSGRSFYTVCHLTSNLLPYYLVKFECSTEQPFTIVIKFKSVQSRLFSVNIYRDVMRWHIYADSCTMLQYVFKISAISTQACFELCMPLVSGCISDVVQCWAKRLTDAVPIYCADVTSNDVNCTQKRQLS